MNKAIQDLKVKIETMKKSQKEASLEMERIEKKSGTTDAGITNRIQLIEEIFSEIYDTNHVRCQHISQRKYKVQKDCNTKHPENSGDNEKTKPKKKMKRERTFPM